MLDLRPAGDGSFSYQKIFADHEFIAAGQLLVPPGSSKPGKSTKDNTYVSLASLDHFLFANNCYRYFGSSKGLYAYGYMRVITYLLLVECSWCQEVLLSLPLIV